MGFANFVSLMMALGLILLPLASLCMFELFCEPNSNLGAWISRIVFFFFNFRIIYLFSLVVVIFI